MYDVLDRPVHASTTSSSPRRSRGSTSRRRASPWPSSRRSSSASSMRHFRLKDRLEAVSDRYEFVVIDTPPALGLITVNALVAATHLLIPVQSSYFALEGTDDLLETVEKIRARPNPDLKLLGRGDHAPRQANDAVARRPQGGHRGLRRSGLRDDDHEEHPPRGEPGAPRVDLHALRLNRVARTSTTGSARRSSNVSSPRRSDCLIPSACVTTPTSSTSWLARRARRSGG